MTPAAIAQLLRDYGASGVSALCVMALAWQSRKLDAAHEREVAALKAVIPVAEKLLTAIAMLETKQRRKPGQEITSPGTPNPLQAVLK